MKLSKRLVPKLVEELNAELLGLALERKLPRSRRLRVDTTVVEACTRYPTDSGLCARAVSRLTRLARQISCRAGAADGAARPEALGRHAVRHTSSPKRSSGGSA